MWVALTRERQRARRLVRIHAFMRRALSVWQPDSTVVAPRDSMLRLKSFYETVRCRSAVHDSPHKGR